MPGDILYNNLMIHADTVLTATSETTGFEVENLSNWNVYDQWKPSATISEIVSIDLGSSKAVDSFAIFGHSLADESASLAFQWSNDGSTGWTDLFTSFTPSDNNIIFKEFTSVTKRYFRIIANSAAGYPSIAIVFVGEKMTLEKGFRVGHMPTGLMDDAKTIQNVSETSLPLGRSTIVQPGKFTIPQTLLTPAWVRSDWIPFLEHAKSLPFFFAWDYDNNPDETVFAWTNGKPSAPVKYSHAARMSASIKILCQKKL